MSPRLLACIRVSVALVWLYEGIWLKVIRQAPHELAVVESIGAIGPLPPAQFLFALGLAESALGVAVLVGIAASRLAWLQLVLVGSMNLIGLLKAGGAISDPVGLLVHNLTFAMCILVLARYGPGWLSFDGARNRHAYRHR